MNVNVSEDSWNILQVAMLLFLSSGGIFMEKILKLESAMTQSMCFF